MSLEKTSNTKRVVIIGAGPAGLLSTINFLRRNGECSSNSNGKKNKYEVMIVDPGQDYGNLSHEQLKANHRSWMIGLSHFGLQAIRKVPGLYENYVSKMGIKLEGASIHTFGQVIKTPQEDLEGYIVDRNSIVSALASFLNDTFGTNKEFVKMYHHKLLYVDGLNKRLLVRGTKDDTAESYVPYDLLVGCDGIRSVVRGAFVQNHYNFDCKISNIFSKFKAVHVELPKSLDAATVHLLPSALPKLSGIALPEKGNVINLSFGYLLHDPIDDAMANEDPKIVAEYLKTHLTGFELVDYDDFANQWVNQAWNSTGQVHCNFYHSLKLQALIIGDAAHATSPSIGMGMNTALGDAEVLDRLMDEFGDNLDEVLPAFSNERVKEGHALSDLSFYLFAMSKSLQARRFFGMVVRGFFHRHFPTLVENNPQSLVGEKLSVVYDKSVKMGIINRSDNDRIIRTHFEMSTGMVSKNKSDFTSSSVFFFIMSLVVVGSAALLIHYVA